MYMKVVTALKDASGKDITGKVVPMPAGTSHFVSELDIGYFRSHPDVFSVAETDISPAAFATDANGNATGLVGPGGGVIAQLPMGVPSGLDWLTDTLHGLDIYGAGFVKRPTLFFDPSATTSLGLGTFKNPYTTQAELMAAVTGNMAGHTIGIKRGTTLRATGTNGLELTLYGTSAKPVTLCPYGDAEALPIITGGAVINDWTLVDSATNIWSYAIGATEHDVWQDGVRLWKKTYSVSAVATLTAEGTATYNSNTLYVRPYNGESPALGQMEVSVVDYALKITPSNVVSTGHVQVCGLDVRKARNKVLAVYNATISSMTTMANLSLVGCRVSGGGVDNSVTLGRDGILVYGASDSVRATDVYLAGNYIEDCLNNAIEISATSGAIIELNRGYNVGGNSIVELWASNDTCLIRYNWGDFASTKDRLQTGPSACGIWFANNYESSGTWNNNDATNAKNANNTAFMNLITNCYSRGFRASGGTGHKFQHNTIFSDPDITHPGNTSAPAGWLTEGTASTGFCNISNNLFYWKPGTQENRYPSVARMGTLGASASIPSGNNNVYFVDWGAGNGNWYYNGSSNGNFTTYKTALSAYSLDQNSLAGADNTGGTLTASSLGFDSTTYRPIASAVSGLTSLSPGSRYYDGQPYTATGCTIGAFKGT